MAEKQDRNMEVDINEIVDNMTLMDDDFMNKVFDKNIPATELVLRTILGRDDIEVISVVGQDELQSSIVGGRKLRLDIVATDKSGVKRFVYHFHYRKRLLQGRIAVIYG